MSPLTPRQLLQRLVAVPSVNPMGAVIGPQHLESRLTDCLESLLSEIGLHTQRLAVEPGRDNLLARLDGNTAPARCGTLVLGAHQDTVPAEGMLVDPFGAEVRGSRLYGRGACDVKGGMAAMLAAVARLARERPPNVPNILLAFTVNEEYGFTGARTLMRHWSGNVGSRPGAAIVAEPTGLELVTAHKGVVRWRAHARGRAAHSSRPEAGDNAIYRMARNVTALECYQRGELAHAAPHSRCGGPTLSVGVIRGGTSVNIVPDSATIEIDRRLMPGEDPDEAWRQAIDYLGRELPPADQLTHDAPFMSGYPLDDGDNRALADWAEAVVREVNPDCRQVAVPYATDAAFFAASGVPAVVLGPGSIDQAHTSDEWIDLDQLDQAAEVYYRLACDAGQFFAAAGA